MNDKILEKKKIDPSESKQSFTEFNIRVHCCRYWILEEWECINMAFPFWRLYYNTKGNAMVTFEGKIHVLNANTFIIIPPNTSFATCLKGSFQNPHNESIVGERVTDLSELDNLEKQNKADHLFIHFNLGLIADTIKPSIYVFENTPELEKTALRIKTNIIRDSMVTDISTTMAIHKLILNLVSSLNPELWGHQSIDQRVMMTMNYIEKNLVQKLNNKELAFHANMAKNSFARLFHKHAQLSLQEYIRKRRIESACNLMHHSAESIESIALKCGFVDRHHLSRIFKKIMNVSPAYYKKFHTING